MPRSSATTLCLGLVVAMATTLVACGGGNAKLLPGETAREITANLDTVKQLTDEGDCLGAENAAAQVSEQIEGLGDVDRKLKQALENGAARLNEVIAECEEAGSEGLAPAEVAPEAEGEEEKASKPEKKEKGKEAKPPPPVPQEPEGHELPPQANGEGKGLEKGNGPPPAAGEEEDGTVSPSGGVSPSSPATGEGG
jgi:hypothetical protein